MSYGVLAEKIKQENWDWNYDGVFVFPNIPHKKLLGAIGSYAGDVEPNEVVILIDDTVFGGAKEGVLVTNKAIYSKALFESPKKVHFKADLNISPGTKSRIMIDDREFFKASTVDHLAMLTVTSRISSIFKSDDEPAQVDNKGTQTVEPIERPTENKKSIQSKAQEHRAGSIFHSSKRTFLSMLQQQGVDKNLITLTSHLYDISLGMSYVDSKLEPFEGEELSWILFNDRTVFQTIIYSYFTAARLLNEHIGEEKTQTLLMPLFLSTLFYYSELEGGNSPSTLKSAINPLASFKESEIAKTFKQNVEWYFRGYHRNDNGIEVARENFKSNVWCYLSEGYDEGEVDFIYEPELNLFFENHSSKKLIEIERSIESTLIKFFNG
ncbi:hypothetical protein V8057_004264 [Vibrio vulnificus]